MTASAAILADAIKAAGLTKAPDALGMTKGDFATALVAALETSRSHVAEKPALARLYEIEHAAWHFLEGGEERVSDSEIAFDLPNEDYDKLVALLGDAHPVPSTSAPSTTPQKTGGIKLPVSVGQEPEGEPDAETMIVIRDAAGVALDPEEIVAALNAVPPSFEKWLSDQPHLEDHGPLPITHERMYVAATVRAAWAAGAASMPSATPRSEPFGWYGMMSNGDGTESPRFESGAKPWCLKDIRDAKPLYLLDAAIAATVNNSPDGGKQT